MDRAEAIRQVGIAWMVFGGVWLVAALGQNRAKKREPASARILYVLVMGGIGVLFYGPYLRTGALDRILLPNARWIPAAGVALMWLGIALAIWARIHIGRYWSGTVSIRENHQLIRTGPYARIRHPIYSGIILALLGAAMAMGPYRAFLGFVIFTAALAWKAKREEALLAGEFGPAFDAHRRATGFLLPGCGVPRRSCQDE